MISLTFKIFSIDNTHLLRTCSTPHRLKCNKDILMKTINDLCRILSCKIEDIAVYIPSKDDQQL